MIRNRGYKYRAYPTKAQCRQFAETFGCVRYVYNHFLQYREERWEISKQSTTYAKTSKELTSLKKEKEWLKDVDSTALQQSLRHLDTAYRNFFEGRAKHPRPKRKRSEQKYRTMNNSNSIRINGDRIKLPKTGWVKVVNTQNFSGSIKSAIVTKTASGRYYITLQVTEEYEPENNAGGRLGIDVGLREFLTDSDGNTVDDPMPLRKHEKRIKRLQRRLSRRQKGSKNRNKTRIKLAREYEKVKDLREDFQNKLTHRLAVENQVVCGEKLNVKGMLGNHHLAKSISDASWSEFYRKLDYKMSDHGGILVQVPTNYPSSQTCSCCGYKNPMVRDLSIREWDCPECGAHHDRDQNAAINILRKGLEMLSA